MMCARLAKLMLRTAGPASWEYRRAISDEDMIEVVRVSASREYGKGGGGTGTKRKRESGGPAAA